MSQMRDLLSMPPGDCRVARAENQPQGNINRLAILALCRLFWYLYLENDLYVKTLVSYGILPRLFCKKHKYWSGSCILAQELDNFGSQKS